MAFQIPQLLVGQLTRDGVLTSQLVDDVQKEAIIKEKDFGQVLVERGIVTDEALLELKSKIYNLPVVDTAGAEVDKELSKEIPENVINVYKFIPFARDQNLIKVALVNPENIDALEALKFIATDRNVQFEKYLISYKNFEALRRNYRNLVTEVGTVLESIPGSELDSKGQQLQISEKTGGLDTITAEAPVTRVVAAIVKHAVETRASDIHIEPFEDKIRLRFRIDGELQTALSLPVNLLSAVVTRIKILCDLKIDETRLAQDGRFSTKINDRTVDFRVSTLPTRNGEKIVLRILDPLVGNIGLTDLGLQGRSLNILLENMAKPFGSILITGPTGSGKSTTLASILRQMNGEDINIITLEDPIEYYVQGVNQSQIHEEIGYTFASGLRHILRQDPDVIMVGEIRDPETAALATQAALTGHIVLSTLHTNDTIGVIPRLIDMHVERYLLAPTLIMALAQRLVRKLCQNCMLKQKANSGEEKIIAQAIASMPPEAIKDLPQKDFDIFKPGPGCRECNGKQYKGRSGIFEVLAMNDELERIILSNISEEELRKAAHQQGMITMFQDGIIKVLQGKTSLQEVLQAAQDMSETDIGQV